jgi:hypothetical protein
MLTFQQVLTLAVRDISRKGYTSPEQVRDWTRRLRQSAQAEMLSDRDAQAMISRSLDAVYQRNIVRGGIESTVPGVGRFKLQSVAPEARAELDRRVAIYMSLIKLNREQAIDATARRFEGWTSSIPMGGSDVVDTRSIKAAIAKPTQQSRFEARRVAIDQGAKFVSSLSEIVAKGSDALAGRWRHIRPRAGYESRPEHVARNNEWFIVPDSWALREGYIRRGLPTIDDVERPAELPFCSCQYVWAIDLEDLPEEMLTAKGREYVAQGRKAA